MKQYLKNLFMALAGRNPFREELEDAKEQLQKAAEVKSATQELLFSALEKWNATMRNLEESDKRAASLQMLTENLRKRIREKDELIKKLQWTSDNKEK